MQIGLNWWTSLCDLHIPCKKRLAQMDVQLLCELED